jgi:hypothetical protein
MAVRTLESNVKTQPEVVVHRARAQAATTERDQTQELISMEEVKTGIEARVKAALDEAMLSTREEIAEPDNWWNLYALGPIQVMSVPAPLFPNQVIKMGETAYVATVLFLNPFLTISPGITPASILSGFALPYEVRYQTGNLSTWSIGPANLNVVHSGVGYNLVPSVYTYVDLIGFSANTPGLYEMNISARLLGATPPYVNAPQFAGFARAIVDFDPDLFISPAPGMEFNQPIRFQVYP